MKYYTRATMPYKIIFTLKDGRTYVAYRSTTESLSYEESHFKNIEVQKMPEQRRLDFVGGR